MPLRSASRSAWGTTNAPAIGLTAEIYRLQDFVVAGLPEGNAQAIAAQRESPNYDLGLEYCFGPVG